jgi:hypothetical protein
MIKFLKKLWKRCFGGMGDSRIKISSTATPVVVAQPRPLHCRIHTRFKKSCPNCLTAVGAK